MRALKIVSLVTASLILVWILLALVSPYEIKSTEQIEINRSPSLVFMQVNKLQNWENWSPWIAFDPDMRQTYSSIKAGKGASVQWVSEKIGNGSQKILESDRPHFIKTQFELNEWDNNSYAEWKFEKLDEEKTRVNWSMKTSKIPFFSRPMGFLIKQQIKKDFKTGLEKLKAHCESLPSNSANSTVDLIKTEEMKYIGIQIETTAKDVGRLTGETFDILQEFMKEKNIALSGYPFTLNLESDSNSTRMIVAMPVDQPVDIQNERIKYGILPAGQAAAITHFGQYQTISASYYILINWMIDNHYPTTKNSYEIYITNPAHEPDTSKWETRIIYPI